MTGCVKIRQHTFPGLSETTMPMSSHKGPLSVQTTLWLHCNQRPALNKTSGWMGAIFTTRTSSQNEGCAGCGDTSTGLFQHPLHWDHWTQRVEKKSDIYCCRLPHKELKSDRRKGGVGRQTRGPSLLTVMNEWITTRSAEAFASTVGAPQMTWLTAQLAHSTCTHPPAEYFTQRPCYNHSTAQTLK